MGKAKQRRLVKLNPSIGARLLRTIVAYKRADAAFKKAKAELAEVGAKYRDLLPDDTETHVGGMRIRRWQGGGGQIFALREYVEAGHPVTKEMALFVRDRERYDVWDVQPIEGPPEP